MFCMVFFHAFYDMAYIFELKIGVRLYDFFLPAEQIFAGTFILIAGISSELSKSNVARGIKVTAIALAMSAATILFIPDQAIYFGVLHMLGISMILYGLLRKFISKIPAPLTAAIFSLAFTLTYNIPNRFFGLPFMKLSLPRSWFKIPYLFPFGIYTDSFYSSDYFPLIPWVLLFFAGTALGRYAKAGRFPQFMNKSRVKPLSFLGHHALVIYVAHQPVIFGLLYIIDYFLGSVDTRGGIQILRSFCVR